MKYNMLQYTINLMDGSSSCLANCNSLLAYQGFLCKNTPKVLRIRNIYLKYVLTHIIYPF